MERAGTPSFFISMPAELLSAFLACNSARSFLRAMKTAAALVCVPRIFQMKKF
jgi:hypothetical protein